MGINQEDFEKLNMRGIVISSIMTAFGLVVALAWKDTINATVEYLMPDSDDGTLKGMYITAVAVTALVMGLAVLVLKVNTRVEKEIERVQSYFDDDDNEDEKKS
uniref:Uncharacterized protein n=1 Tax=uncultured marine group II/III euryarchaeote AD1000_23_H03 TaxID=1457740 RepID=A0A075FSS3_9EURY|nr:hypothetical protein [uncultured marine group II/III euryarchaeote AD1000_23_H03]